MADIILAAVIDVDSCHCQPAFLWSLSNLRLPQDHDFRSDLADLQLLALGPRSRAVSDDSLSGIREAPASWAGASRCTWVCWVLSACAHACAFPPSTTGTPSAVPIATDAGRRLGRSACCARDSDSHTGCSMHMYKGAFAQQSALVVSVRGAARNQHA